MAKAFTVRRLEAGEWAKFRELRLRALADAPDAFGGSVEETAARTETYWHERTAMESRSDTSAMYIAVAPNDEWVGIAGVFVDDKPDVAHIISMWVEPAWRRRGVGRALLDIVIEWAHAHGAVRLRLEVTEGNAGARSLYERAGFVPTGNSRPLPSNPSLTAIEMER